MKYGLNLRRPSSQQKKQPTRRPCPSAFGFGYNDDDDIEREISRQAGKNKALKDVEEQHKKALEEDPSVFNYDGVYDEIKAKELHPAAQDRQERKSIYIPALIHTAKAREREREVIHDRKVVKERSKEDHLFADKEKFVTGAYKRKLAERAKWLEEERLHQLREEKEDITKGGDMTEFYFNLPKNVAFGARDCESEKPHKHREESKIQNIKRRSTIKAQPASASGENIGETSANFKKKSDRKEIFNDSTKKEFGTEDVAVKPPLARKRTKENVD